METDAVSYLGTRGHKHPWALLLEMPVSVSGYGPCFCSVGDIGLRRVLFQEADSLPECSVFQGASSNLQPTGTAGPKVHCCPALQCWPLGSPCKCLEASEVMTIMPRRRSVGGAQGSLLSLCCATLLTSQGTT